MATEMERFKAGFLARSSHELRSPINSVISLHQLILADLCEDPAEEREFIAQAQSAAEKMLSLLDRLISISKTIYGTESLQIQPLQLELVLGEVLHFTQLQARNRSLHLEIEPPDPEIYVLADPRWLRQILIYLIDTPITLMQEGYIRLKTQADWQEQRVNIWIEDQRPAAFWRDPIDWLPEGTQPLPKLLQLSEARAAHLDESNMPPSPGLNLLIVQTLLELMGGELLLLATPEEDSSALDAASNQPAHLSPSSAPNFTQIQCSLPLAPAGEATPGS
jgi:K+-sensing histidine kinase KdpD